MYKVLDKRRKKVRHTYEYNSVMSKNHKINKKEI